MQYIAFDTHKHYTLASMERPEGGLFREERISHERGNAAAFLGTCQGSADSAVADKYWSA